MLSISVVVATYNEIKNLPELVYEVFNSLDELKCESELIIVDDNSPDGTFGEALRLGKLNNRIRPILRESNKGLGASIYEGLKAARNEIIFIMDADLSHSPKEFKNILLNFCDSKVDMVWCSRYVKGGKIEEPKRFTFQFYLSKIFNILIKNLLCLQIYDTTNGFFGFRKKLFNENDFLECFTGYGDFSFLFLHKLNCKKKVTKFSVIEIPSVYYQRRYGESKTNLMKVGISYLYEAIKARLR